MKSLGLFLGLILVVFLASAQETTLTLNDCYKSMLVSYPLVQQADINTKASELNIKNIKSKWLPNAELNMQASYQSDAMKVDIEAMGNSFGFEADKDQYKASIDINQMIYDWGRIKSSKQIEQSDLNIKQQSNQVEVNKVKEQVNKFYFAVLILERNKELLEVMLKDLESKEQTVSSAVKNGVMLNSDLYALQAEIIKLKQSINQINQQELSAREILSELCGIDILDNTALETPSYEVDFSKELYRPESVLFKYQREKLDLSSNLVAKQNKPTVFAFSQLGYGKPGLNMASSDFDSYYYVGVGLNWKFWDWNKTKREKQVLMLNKDLISVQENAFNKQISLALNNEKAQIQIYMDAIGSDQEIIKLREEVSKSARSKLDHGVITSTDYITEIGKETQAKINYETHKIQLIQAKVNYLYLKGEI